MLYNEELKLRFISERRSEATLPENYLERSFKQAALLEEKLNKDLCNFTYYDIIELYKRKNTTSVGTLQVLNSQLSIYTDWCMKQNLVGDNQNHFLELRLEDYHNCVNKGVNNIKVLTKEDIMELVGRIPNPCDQFMILASFEGLKGKSYCDIVLLKEEHLFGNDIQLPSNGKTRRISDELVEIIQECIKTNIYYCYSDEDNKIIELIDSGYIIKNKLNIQTDTPARRGERASQAIKKIIKYLGIEYIGLKDIYTSGKIHFLKTEAAKHGLSISEYIDSEWKKDYELIYGKIKSKPDLLKSIEDYL